MKRGRDVDDGDGDDDVERKHHQRHEKKKLTDDIDPGAEGLRHRLVLVGLEALDDDLLIR